MTKSWLDTKGPLVARARKSNDEVDPNDPSNWDDETAYEWLKEKQHQLFGLDPFAEENEEERAKLEIETYEFCVILGHDRCWRVRYLWHFYETYVIRGRVRERTK